MNTAQIPQSDPEISELYLAALDIMPLEKWIFINRNVGVDIAQANQASKYLNIKNPPANKRIPKRQGDGFTGDEHFCSALRVINRHSQNARCNSRKYSP